MSEQWDCKCGVTGTGETSAKKHAAECGLLGFPWTNPAWPRPEEKP